MSTSSTSASTSAQNGTVGTPVGDSSLTIDMHGQHLHNSNVILQFIIVGGGISGLATAYTLKKAGHDVLLLEQTDGTSRSTGGLRSPPNLTRILNQWGLGPKLDRVTWHCQRVDVFSEQSDEKIGHLVMYEDFIKELVAAFVFVQHGELHSMILDLAQQEGVTFRFNTTVVGIDAESGTIFCADGEQLHADVIVGADGHNSKIRPLVVGVEEKQEQEQKQILIFNFVLQTDELMADDVLKSLTTSPPVWALWLGDGYVVHGNPLNDGKDYSVTILHDYQGPVREGDENWRINCDLNQFGIESDKMDIRVKRLLDLANKNGGAKIVSTKPCLESLVCDRSKTILVGEAAHPLLPGGNHSTALSIEDAQTLGCLFARIQSKSQLKRLVTAYDEIRQPRVTFAHAYDRAHQAIFKLPPGPAQEERDDRLRRTLVQRIGDNMDETLFREMWGNELKIYAYDATEKVDDWWGQYGSMIVKMPHRRSVLSDAVAISVSQETTT